jgi:rhodanese-related sulfurtransferase
MQDLSVFISNHLSLAYGLAAVLTLLFIVEFLRAKLNTTSVDTQRALQLINHEQAVVIDIRPNDAFRKGHVIDAVSFPADDLTENSKKLEKYKTKPLVIICGTGIEAQKVAATLAKQGYNSFALAGGLRAWSEDGLPLIS